MLIFIFLVAVSACDLDFLEICVLSNYKEYLCVKESECSAGEVIVDVKEEGYTILGLSVESDIRKDVQKFVKCNLNLYESCMKRPADKVLFCMTVASCTEMVQAVPYEESTDNDQNEMESERDAEQNSGVVQESTHSESKNEETSRGGDTGEKNTQSEKGVSEEGVEGESEEEISRPAENKEIENEIEVEIENEFEFEDNREFVEEEELLFEEENIEGLNQETNDGEEDWNDQEFIEEEVLEEGQNGFLNENIEIDLEGNEEIMVDETGEFKESMEGEEFEENEELVLDEIGEFNLDKTGEFKETMEGNEFEENEEIILDKAGEFKESMDGEEFEEKNQAGENLEFEIDQDQVKDLIEPKFEQGFEERFDAELELELERGFGENLEEQINDLEEDVKLEQEFDNEEEFAKEDMQLENTQEMEEENVEEVVEFETNDKNPEEDHFKEENMGPNTDEETDCLEDTENQTGNQKEILNENTPPVYENTNHEDITQNTEKTDEDSENMTLIKNLNEIYLAEDTLTEEEKQKLSVELQLLLSKLTQESQTPSHSEPSPDNFSEKTETKSVSHETSDPQASEAPETQPEAHTTELNQEDSTENPEEALNYDPTVHSSDQITDPEHNSDTSVETSPENNNETPLNEQATTEISEELYGERENLHDVPTIPENHNENTIIESNTRVHEENIYSEDLIKTETNFENQELNGEILADSQVQSEDQEKSEGPILVEINDVAYQEGNQNPTGVDQNSNTETPNEVIEIVESNTAVYPEENQNSTKDHQDPSTEAFNEKIEITEISDSVSEEESQNPTTEELQEPKEESINEGIELPETNDAVHKEDSKNPTEEAHANKEPANESIDLESNNVNHGGVDEEEHQGANKETANESNDLESNNVDHGEAYGEEYSAPLDQNKEDIPKEDEYTDLVEVQHSVNENQLAEDKIASEFLEQQAIDSNSCNKNCQIMCEKNENYENCFDTCFESFCVKESEESSYTSVIIVGIVLLLVVGIVYLFLQNKSMRIAFEQGDYIIGQYTSINN